MAEYDNEASHKWVCDEDGCDCEAIVDVWWYVENGTPMCSDCDMNMVPFEREGIVSCLKENLSPALEGSCRNGTLVCSYVDIVSQLGDPNIVDDETKVDASWGVKHKDGRELYVWNYKNGKNYLGAEGLEVEDIEEWSCGGSESLANDIFGKAIKWMDAWV